jgi:hypothetical protein
LGRLRSFAIKLLKERAKRKADASDHQIVEA